MQLHQVLSGPIITEKSVRLQESNQHVFRVHKDASKIDVIRAIRTFYGVTPLSVQIVKNPKKVRAIGRGKTMTKRPDLKKAIVRLEKGKSIELVQIKDEKKVSEKVDKKPAKKKAVKAKATS